MRCHYEVLGVPRDATPEELKKAYRTISLKWHPDKNNNSQESTEKFQEIQAAYSVLNDVNERAWYDRHRESILRGKDQDDGEVTDTDVKIWEFFSTASFKGFGDDSNRFAFRTKKEMYQHDEYNPQEGPTREVRRAMEAHNKKLREKAKRSFSELVQALARFVNKQDPRVKRRKEETKQQEAEKRRQQEAKKAEQAELAKQQREEQSRRLLEAEPDDLDRLIAAGEYGRVEEEEEEEFYCPLCRKAFRNPKQLKNHENSKKHKEAVQAFQAEFGDEESEEGSEEEEEEEGEEEKEEEEGENREEGGDAAEEAEEEGQKAEAVEEGKLSEEGENEVEGEKGEAEQEVPKDGEAEAEEEEEEEEEEQVLLSQGSGRKARQRGKKDSDDEGKPSKRDKRKARAKAKGKGPASVQIVVEPLAKGKKGRGKDNACQVCGDEFPSKNALFKHISATGHAALKN